MIFSASLAFGESIPYQDIKIDFSRDPETVLVSFSEIFPEFADQDRTPLVRIYGDGRVLVHYPAYMRKAGQYEMSLSGQELEVLLRKIAVTLIGFDTNEVKQQKQASNELLWASARTPEELTVFHDADAEISVFELNIRSFQLGEAQDQIMLDGALKQSWRGLRFDARDYPGLGPIQALMEVEKTLRALGNSEELTLVGPPS